MSEFLRDDPGVLRFSDSRWRLIPVIDDAYRHLNAALKYTSFASGFTRVVFQHFTDNPDTYLFSAGPEQDGSYEVYDLAVDRTDESAKLQVMNYIGEVPGIYEKEQAEEWAKFQSVSGMIAPDERNKMRFQRLLKHFYIKYMVSNR